MNNVRIACVAGDRLFATEENRDKPYLRDEYIEMVQRRAARYTLNRYRKTESVTNMLDELGWDTLETRRKKSRLVMFYKIQKLQIAVNFLCRCTEPVGTSIDMPTRCHNRKLAITKCLSFQNNKGLELSTN